MSELVRHLHPTSYILQPKAYSHSLHAATYSLQPTPHRLEGSPLLDDDRVVDPELDALEVIGCARVGHRHMERVLFVEHTTRTSVTHSLTVYTNVFGVGYCLWSTQRLHYSLAVCIAMRYSLALRAHSNPLLRNSLALLPRSVHSHDGSNDGSNDGMLMMAC